MLTTGDRVKYSEGFLDCWNKKDREMYAAKRGVVTIDNGMGGKVLWDNGEEAKVFCPDLDQE